MLAFQLKINYSAISNLNPQLTRLRPLKFNLTQSILKMHSTNAVTTSENNEFVVLGISINVPLRRLFDYKISVNNAIEPKVGMRVEVSFSNRIKIGVVNTIGASSNLSLEKIKPINRLLDDFPLVNQNIIKLSQWMQGYYHAAPGDVWSTILPNALLKGEDTELARESYWRLTDLGLEFYQQKKIPKNAVKQQLAMACLFEVTNHNSAGLAHSQMGQYSLSLTTLKTLAGKKWIERVFDSPQVKNNNFRMTNNNKTHIKLNEQQDFAVSQVSKELDIYKTWLLFGVTASGKTEVYLRIIESVLKQGKQALVLVPEIGLTPQTVSRFERRFNTKDNHVEIAMMHSGMSDKQRLQSWLKAKNGQAKIIIGTRSALFVPLKNPGIIIIDEEHDTSFKQQQGLRYSARDIAMVRANIEKIPVLLASATPSIETLVNVEKNKITQLDLTEKALTSVEIKCRVIDMKKQPIKQGLSFHLIDSIKHHLKQKGQILLFLNRRGYAPVLLCHQCGWSSECKRCERHFTFHGGENKGVQNKPQQHLQCHHCGSSRRAPKQCPNCQCDEMVPIGLGTERLEETIKNLFPSARVQRIDRDTTRKKSAMDGFISSIKLGEIDILIGTQMLAKGHHFPNITLVGLVDMDGALYSSDFRAPEYAAQLITQVSGRAGRAENKGEVIIQTHLADHPMLSELLNSGYRAFAKTAIDERKEASLPPISYNALIQAEAPSIGVVKNFLQEVKDILKNNLSNQDNQLLTNGLELLGPVPAVYTKKAGKFRYQLYLQANERQCLHQLLRQSVNEIEKLKSASRVRWRLEIDPISD
jgi:primosomal protein N' (replication factor Y)